MLQIEPAEPPSCDDGSDGCVIAETRGQTCGDGIGPNEVAEKSATAQDVELAEPTIWVGGCPADISKRALFKQFSKCGSVNHVAIKYSKRDTFAFVTFKEIGGAAEAVKRYDKAILFGGVIKVAPASRKNMPPQEQSRRDGRFRVDFRSCRLT